MAAQTYAALTAAQRNAYNMVLLERSHPYTPMFKDAVKATIPDHQGTTMEWRIYGGANANVDGSGLALATTPLVEGQTPAASVISAFKITQAAAQYGSYVELSDLLVHQGIDPIWTEAYELLGEQAGQTLHTLLCAVLAAGSAVQYAGAGTTMATMAAGMVLSTAEIQEAVRDLRKKKVPTFSDGFYHGLMTPDAEYSMMKDADWKAISTYNGGSANGGNSLIKNAIGDYLGVRWQTSTDAPIYPIGTSGSIIATHGTLIWGPRWYGSIDLESYGVPGISPTTQKGIQAKGVPVDTETKDDPLGQRGVAGWKTSFGARELHAWRGVRIVHALV